MRVLMMRCPQCHYEFVVDVEFEQIDGAYCACPRCAREFPPKESEAPLAGGGTTSHRMDA